ncbi:hypothetical protein [Kurthia sibirica]|uniref:Uncharacterized protein n=1 Tax=Kurthia sibirica TaxID=202750 RepID=A0A2U3APV6_9BACL|nr:hypothetical protein [Kurthia sibirica]PWI26573.1 hypothetical protein DEX24_02070 [Kurthia sibirica]GEK32823.1 hypothetical protein KSI01_03560 [Kurthia sibirica]
MKKVVISIVIILFFVLAFLIGFNYTNLWADDIETLQSPSKPPIKKIQSNDTPSYKIGDQAIQKLEKRHGDLLYEGYNATSYEMDNTSTNIKKIVTFSVQKNTLSVKKTSRSNQFNSVVADTALQQQLWQNFTAIIPAENRQMIVQFEIITDGIDGILGYVQQLNNPQQWSLALDYKDAANLNALYATIVHEYGHLFSLNSYEFSSLQQTGCKNYAPDEGCLKKSSYLNMYYDDFWKGTTISEWREDSTIADDSDIQSAFFATHPGEFVTEYATSHPVEDFAESWMYFVLSEKPQRYTLSDDKILFFYNFPELIQLRNTILTNLVKRY